ncbi:MULTISPECIES: ATP-binding protein [unclassified Streptomyces]|uniref:ATP-binding protein n=2 Tax=Streptomyces johnsoniae TaxID=3075532 RepID=A0ABU2RWY1_9ACTN|nr:MULTISPECIES: ATP-binding protein [unclassified Streptomyces]MDT0441242.1 ATP-binding protein [Streptomyces sp. DSM 41886]ONK11070.1 Histidine kinase-, DNA gyrase B-, and HSP90-likeATPase [Streptomyces sp. MP131-18]
MLGVREEDESTDTAWDLGLDPSAGEIRLPSRARSARVARRLTQRQLQQRWLLPAELTDDAVLLVSELVGNAVQHAGAAEFGLRIRRRRGWIRVEVRDPSRALPCHLPVREMDVVSGRGLFLVDTLADRWGVDLLADGKCTWFEMRVSYRPVG